MAKNFGEFVLFQKKVLLILGIYSEAIVEDAEDEEDGEEFHSATTRLQPDWSIKETKISVCSPEIY
jgi:hypothetical protein